MLPDTWRTSNRYGVRCAGRTHHLAGEVAGRSLKNAVNMEISPITRGNAEGNAHASPNHILAYPREGVLVHKLRDFVHTFKLFKQVNRVRLRIVL